MRRGNSVTHRDAPKRSDTIFENGKAYKRMFSNLLKTFVVAFSNVQASDAFNIVLPSWVLVFENNVFNFDASARPFRKIETIFWDENILLQNFMNHSEF